MRSRWLWAGVVLLALAATLRLVGLGWYDLSGDEAYHWLWSQHLALAYYDEPGAIAWLTAASVAVFGRSEAGLRAGTSVVGIAAWLAFAALAWALRDRRAAILALLLGLACPPLLMAARRDTAEPLVELAALAAVTFVVVAERRPRWLPAAGIAL